MKTIKQLATDIVEQWENHDKYRVTEADKILFNDGETPNDVVLAKWVLFYVGGDDEE